MGVKKGENHFRGTFDRGFSMVFRNTPLLAEVLYQCQQFFLEVGEDSLQYSPSSEFTAGTGRALPIHILIFLFN